MRDPKRIEEIIKEFQKLWERHPDFRFGQLVNFIANTEKIFYIEDDKWLDLIKDK